MVTLSVVLPAYRERQVIERSLRRLSRYLEEGAVGASRWGAWEIVVVDDGSDDGTAEAARDALAGDPRLTVVRHGSNRGKGAAVATGAAAARGDLIVVTDVDLSYALEDIGAVAGRLVEGADRCDLVAGDRRHPDSRMDLALSALGHVVRRQTISAIFRFGARLIYGLDPCDTQCGLKGFTREAAARILPRLRTSRFLADVEIFLIAQRLGLRAAGVPVHLTYLSADSTVHVLRQAPAVLADAVRIKLAQIRSLYG